MKLPSSLILILSLLLALSSTVDAQTPNDSGPVYEKALRAFNDGDTDTAYIHLKNLLKAQPDSLSGKILMGKILLQKGLYADANLEFEEVIQLGADMSLILLPYSQSLLVRGEYQKLLALNPKTQLNTEVNYEWQLARAAAQASIGDAENAERSFQRAIQLQPENPRAINNLASFYLQQNKLSMAEQRLQQVLLQYPQQSSSLRLMAQVTKAKGDIDEALRYAEQAYDIAPDNPLIQRTYADLAWDNGQWHLVESLLQQILAHTPDDPNAMLMQARLLARDQQSDDAEQLLVEIEKTLGKLSQEQLTQDQNLSFVSGITAYFQQNYEQALSQLENYRSNSASNLNRLLLLSDIYQKLGREKDALRLMEGQESAVLQSYPLSLRLCDLYVGHNKVHKCVALLDNIEQQHPQHIQTQFMRAKVLTARGRFPQALELLQSLTPGQANPQRDLALAHLHLQLENLDVVGELVTALLSTQPSNEDVLNLAAAYQISLSNWSAAENYARSALQVAPQYDAAMFNLANVLAATGRYAEAITTLQQMGEQAQQSEQRHLLFSDILRAQGQIKEATAHLEGKSIQALNSAAVNEKLVSLYLQSGQHERALALLNSLIRSNFFNTDYWLQKAEALIQLGRQDEAAEQLQLAFQESSENPTNLTRIGSLQRKAGDYQAAAASLNQALTLAPNQPLARLELIRLHQHQRQWQQAMTQVSVAQRDFPNNPDVFSLKGQVSIATGDLDAARQAFEQALELAPGYQLAAIQLYQLAKQNIGHQQFLQRMQQLLQQDPQKHFYRRLLADLHYLQQNHSKALAHYQRLVAAESYTDKAAVLNNMANIHLPKQPALAFQLIEQALELQPNHPAYLDSKGWIQAQQGQLNEALITLREAYSRDATNLSTRYHLAYVLHGLGRTKEALEELQQVLSADTNFAERSEAQALLARLE